MKKKRIAIFAGSFDPITRGHESIVLRALELFDEIHIVIGINPLKSSMFSTEQRLQWIRETFVQHKQVQAFAFEGLIVNYCKQVGSEYILRGIRSTTDFQYEQNIARVNQAIDEKIETIFMLTLTEGTAISSSAVREILSFGGDVSRFVPAAIAHHLLDIPNE